MNHGSVGHSNFVSLSQKTMEKFCSRIIVRFLGKDSRQTKPFVCGGGRRRWAFGFWKSLGESCSFICLYTQQMYVK